MPISKISNLSPRWSFGEAGKSQISKPRQTRSKPRLKTKSLKKKAVVSKKETTRPIVAAKKQGLVLDFFDIKGKAIETVDLPKEMFGAKINGSLMAQAVRVYLANQRVGTASTKTRGEVHGSTRKIWRQKGTGRARHGSRKAPIFVHGGVVFGPKPRDFSLKLSKKMNRLALFSSLSSKLKEGAIKGLAGFEKLEPKTRIFAAALNKIGIDNKYKKIALVLPSTKEDFQNLYRAGRNIEGLTVLNASLLNVYAVLNSDLMLFAKDSLKTMEDTFLKKEEKHG